MEGPPDRRPLFIPIEKFLPFDGKRFGKFERDGSLRREFDVLSAGGAGCRESASRADTSANGRTLAAAGKAADERANCRSSAGDDCGSLALAFLPAAVRVGCDHVSLAVNFDARQTNGQDGFALEGALFFGVDDASCNVRVLRNRGSAFNDDGFGDCGFKFVARSGYTRTDRGGQHHGDGSACRYDDGPRGFRSGLLGRDGLAGSLLAAVGGWICRGVALVAAGGQSEHCRQSECCPFTIHGSPHFLNVQLFKRCRSGDGLAWVSAGLHG